LTGLEASGDNGSKMGRTVYLEKTLIIQEEILWEVLGEVLNYPHQLVPKWGRFEE
jgi:hypothetical protein